MKLPKEIDELLDNEIKLFEDLNVVLSEGMKSPTIRNTYSVEQLKKMIEVINRMVNNEVDYINREPMSYLEIYREEELDEVISKINNNTN
jgi:hypothetical protein